MEVVVEEKEEEEEKEKNGEEEHKEEEREKHEEEEQEEEYRSQWDPLQQLWSSSRGSRAKRHRAGGPALLHAQVVERCLGVEALLARAVSLGRRKRSAAQSQWL